MTSIVKNVWKKSVKLLNEKIIKIEGEADPIAIEKIIQEVGYTPVQLQKENNQS